MARHAILFRVAGTLDEPLKTSAWEASFVCAEAVLFNKTEMIRLRVLEQIEEKVMLLLFLTDVSDAGAQASKGSERKLSFSTSELSKGLRTTGFSNFMMCIITLIFQLLKT